VSDTPSNVVLARLNSLAPQQSKNAALDYLTWTSGGATALLNQTNPAPTAPSMFPSKTALAVSASTAAPTQQLTFTATVTGVIPPTGNVSFTSGSTTLGAASLTNGVATLSISFPATGTYAVTASYAGDANNQTSSSNPVSVAVTPVTSKTTLTISTSSANPNQQLTFTATVTGSNPTGDVTFISGSTTLGTASLANGTASLPFSFTTAGSFTVTANYAGDAANLASSSNTITVTVVAPDFTVSASPTTATHRAWSIGNDDPLHRATRRLHRNRDVLLRNPASRSGLHLRPCLCDPGQRSNSYNHSYDYNHRTNDCPVTHAWHAA
jgi:hypothetical protein